MAAMSNSPSNALDRSVAAEILDRVSEGEPLRAVLRSAPERFPGKTQWYAWLAEDEALAARFRQAREEGADAIAEECLEIADDSSEDYRPGKDGPVFDSEHVQRSKLRIDTRLKLLAKWFPQRYGESVTLRGDASNPLEVRSRTHELTDEELAALAAQGARRAPG